LYVGNRSSRELHYSNPAVTPASLTRRHLNTGPSQGYSRTSWCSSVVRTGRLQTQDACSDRGHSLRCTCNLVPAHSPVHHGICRAPAQRHGGSYTSMIPTSSMLQQTSVKPVGSICASGLQHSCIIATIQTVIEKDCFRRRRLLYITSQKKSLCTRKPEYSWLRQRNRP
jgi:hypothetical protein